MGAAWVLLAGAGGMVVRARRILVDRQGGSGHGFVAAAAVFAGGGAGGSGCGGGAGAVVGVMPDWWMRSALMRLKIRCIAGRTNRPSSMKKS